MIFKISLVNLVIKPKKNSVVTVTFRDRINKLKEDAPENVSYEIIYSIALYESLKAQQDMKILNTVKYLLNRD